MLFPSSYPRLPPLVTFSTDMFHPLVTPLSTYMYTTDIQDNGTVSASDDERLPAGGFSLRHGFPQWFGRRKSNASGSRRTSGQQLTGLGITMDASRVSTPASVPSPAQTLPSYMQASPDVSICDVLRYIRSTFDNEEVLDSVPLSASGNPGAWHAWRTHRRASGKLQDDTPLTGSIKSQSPESPMTTTKRASVIAARHPGQWNWEGVWVDRVKKGIAASLSEPVLYGASGAPGSPDDLVWLIHFLKFDDSVSNHDRFGFSQWRITTLIR